MTAFLLSYTTCDPTIRRILSDVRLARRENSDHYDAMWYQCGFYDLIGCDRHGNTFTTVDDDDRSQQGYQWARQVDEDRRVIWGR